MKYVGSLILSAVVFIMLYSLDAVPVQHGMEISTVLGVAMIYAVLLLPITFGMALCGALIGNGLAMMVGFFFGPGTVLWVLSKFTAVAAPDLGQAALFGLLTLALQFTLRRIFGNIGK